MDGTKRKLWAEEGTALRAKEEGRSDGDTYQNGPRSGKALDKTVCRASGPRQTKEKVKEKYRKHSKRNVKRYREVGRILKRLKSHKTYGLVNLFPKEGGG